MKELLVVVDMQNDFIDGALGTKEATEIVENVKAKIKEYPAENIFVTRDTHEENYLETQEGRMLPVKHCIKGTEGWEVRPEIAELLSGATFFDKPCFGSVELAKHIAEVAKEEEISVELIGLCTDICVVSNALLIKAMSPEIPVSVDSSCCAGVTPEKHEAALATMASCQVNVK